MTFHATTVALDRALTTLKEIGAQQLTYLNRVNGDLTANVSAQYAMDLLANYERVLPMMDALANKPGMPAFAQAQEGGAAYDVVAEYSAYRAALDAIRLWLRANIPANAFTVTNGALVGTVFTPAQTAPLKALVVTAISKVD